MGTLKVDGDDEKIARFKQKAREKYGYGRGSIKKATMELIEKWIENESPDWSSLRGVADSEKDSVEAEKEAWRRVD